MTAWGKRSMKKSDGGNVDFPAIMRNKSCIQLYREYRAYRKDYPLGGTLKLFERSTFVAIVQKIRKIQRTIKACVDYIIGNLLHDNTRVIKRIMYTEMDDVGLRKELHKKLEAVVDFLKFGYNARINVDEDVAHQPEHAILCTAHDDERIDRQWDSGITQFQQCMSVLQVMNDVCYSMPERRGDVVTVLENCRKKDEVRKLHLVSTLWGIRCDATSKNR